MKKDALIIVRGGGDLATGTIHRLWSAGLRVLVLETTKPAAIRRQVALCEAVYEGEATVEELRAVRIEALEQALSVWAQGAVPVLVDPEGACIARAKPEVVVDAILAKRNLGHSAMAAWGLRFLQPAPDAMVLDCGCGGGANIKTLLKLCPKGKVQGIDYSAVSVEKARKVNADAIAAGRCTVQQASVAELPFEAEQFEVVTAFETVYFWPELAQNFGEVYRVLKPGGVFFICNEANGETAKDDKWTQIINGMTIYTDTALKTYLEQAGFCKIQSHKNKKGWLCVTAQKR